ncbi:aspartyl/glutamyl-tRNA amidotransferase subunit A [Candidatus Saccharibacteria bacterium]|nr:aspartyl/glutamyl-tRNA amidotransferase subunit A [Candidatus Saccharibacteria bacterium]
MKIADKTTSAVQMVKEALEKAKRYEDYHVFVSLDEGGALKRAKEIDEQIQKGENPGRLAGVPYALKDNFLSPRGATTASSKILEPLNAPITATAVEKLEAEGAIMLGRANLDSFAHGSSTENSYFGPTKNSKDKERVAGGSSGGSAVAVALDIVQFATGTDTGGSIRQPASFNGVYGFKPTYGTISRYGVVAMASSLDCVGFFANSPEDIDLLMQICAGQDDKDQTTLPDYYNEDSGMAFQLGLERARFEEDFRRAGSCVPSAGCPARKSDENRTRVKQTTEKSFPNLRIGIVNGFDQGLSEDIKRAYEQEIEILKSAGYEIVELDMPTLKYALPVYYIIQPAEVASNLSRHDGIRYGYRAEDAKDLGEIYGKSRSEGFMPENKRRIMIGNFVLSSGFYDAYFLKAAKARTLIIEEYNEAFDQCDFILTPVSPNPAFKLGEKSGDPLAMYMEDVLSVPLNLAGLPGLAFPVGKTGDGLDLGLQLVGPRRSDRRLLDFAAKIRKELK